jgi:predicted RNA-binding protein associated with RNAse of E/G family
VGRPLKPFERGEVAVRRHIWFGRIANVKPLTVVEDSDEILALSLTPGTPFKIATPRADRLGHLERLRSKSWELHNDMWTGSRALILARPDARYSIWGFWADTDGSFEGWYVNFEDPLRRSPVGFDTRDLFLDIVVPAGERWRWKDEDEFEEAVRIGLISEQEATTTRSVAKDVIDLIERGDAWWLAWQGWAPDASWPIPTLPDGWDVL